MTLRQRRLMWIAIGIVILGIATALVLQAFRSNLVYFYTPTQVANAEAPKSRAFRIGGLVEAGSLKRGDNLTVEFRVTDTARTVMVAYKGILPDLFREGKGVVALGSMQPDGLFHASEVYAKHDENYMPPEAAEALKRAGKPIEGQIFAGESGVVTQPAATTPPPPAPKS